MLPSEEKFSEAPKHTPGKSRNVSNNINKDWTSLEGEEGRKNYEAYLTDLAKNR